MGVVQLDPVEARRLGPRGRVREEPRQRRGERSDVREVQVGDALAVAADFEWDDLGGWTAAGKYFPKDAEGNASNIPVQSLDARSNIVFSSDPTQHIALIGVSDLIVVNTGDALLVCSKERAESIKQLLAALPERLH